MPAAPEHKKFSLKPVESQVIAGLQQTHAVNIANALSYIALERLAYPVSKDTKFSLSPDLKDLEIWDEPKPETAPAQDASADGVITS